jgi:hypothetical protein
MAEYKKLYSATSGIKSIVVAEYNFLNSAITPKKEFEEFIRKGDSK